ncbi:amino acid adenylation domain-containing protein [Streptomyces sp. NPDC007346]|uniref:non-ribosomal peptide synthetase family protein n=1 Tax=Streptomyces sp. NPDC007346 TaxID=3154682 RepID=UPI0034558AE3
MSISTSTFDIRQQHASLPDLLHHQARERRDDTAVVSAEGRLTFGELHLAAQQLGSHLAGIGVSPDTCVGLFVEPSADLVTGVWGILAAGAAYLPLSPDYPDSRLRYMASDAGVGVVVTQRHLRARLTGLVPEGTSVVTVDEAAATPANAVRPLPEPREDHLAYVIHTSGSTGSPKGVMIEHRSVVAQLRWLERSGYLGPSVSILQKTPISFDAAQWEVLACAAGARVVMSPPGSFRDPQAIIDTIRAHGVTALQGVPTLLRALADSGEFDTCSTLTRIFSGGEALTRTLAQDLLSTLPGVSLVNLYGPTEATINATSLRVDPDILGDESLHILPIGRPADNVTCHILDENLRPTGTERGGELFIGGVQVARGYLGRPDVTRERFIASPFDPDERLYRTGDLARWNADGTIQYEGRTDNQVKLRGYRVELEEVASRVEEHTWVRKAAAVVTDNPRTGSQVLVAAVELNEHTAAVMDQGRSDAAHHQSKSSKLQVKAQLADPGLREPAELAGRPVIPLAGAEATAQQRRVSFARKSYRFYEGGRATLEGLQALLSPPPVQAAPPRGAGELTAGELGSLLRWMGPHRSPERLLPKYAYASPGALYATQLYLEADGVAGLSGVYYHHPADHTLVRVGDHPDPGHAPDLKIHFLGKRRAIEPVYKNNIVEVLEFEAGHMLGVLEEVLPGLGLMVRPDGFDPAYKARLDVADEDHYLGTFAVVPHDDRPRAQEVELYVQAHGDRVDGLPGGLYLHQDGTLVRLGEEVVERRHVIAINQGVYDRASFGISAVARTDDAWRRYMVLGTLLHRLQRMPGTGLMSSGYSSRTGHPLPASQRLDDLLRRASAPAAPASYFFVGGPISEAQAEHEGMNEDAVHTKGPAEMIRDDAAQFLPDYMVPSRVVVVDRLPVTANGKTDLKATALLPEVAAGGNTAAHVEPNTPTERWLAAEWGRLLGYEEVSTQDEFFSSGGNSLHSVALVNRINKRFGTRLPLQTVFETPTLAGLAARIDDRAPAPASRLVRLNSDGAPAQVFAWPGLGGYPMNLRTLALGFDGERSVAGVQAYGINDGEAPHTTIRHMAEADIAEIRRIQPTGPYTLWGYSFGARVAFETAWQLEQAGEKVENLLLICPGNPHVRTEDGRRWGREASFANPVYVTILHSVFAGTTHGPAVEACLRETTDEDSFVAFVHRSMPALSEGTIRRIVQVVGATYEFEYTFRELRERRVEAPVTIFKARGDDYSFLEDSSGYSAEPPRVIPLAGDHYEVLKEHGVAELLAGIRTLDIFP